AVEIAVALNPTHAHINGLVFVLFGLFFVWKSFYKMRINDSDKLTKFVEEDKKDSKKIRRSLKLKSRKKIRKKL
ncbi:hypothetical protein IJJ97_06595, partial [bacterium]|nr:hypothetical protein [bacterium]